MTGSERQTAPSRGPARFAVIAPAIALGAMVLCAYWPATGADFVWDDDQHFVEDRLMTAPGGLYRIWFAPNQSVWNYWPLSRTSFWIERRLWGVNAFASHLSNILLHLASVVILYFGLRRFRAPGAWFIAALFAVHPIFVESVAWITERKNVLSGVFYLLCLWSYLKFDENRQWRWYAAAISLFACCLLSKSSTIMLPAILVCCRLALRRPWERRDFLLLVPFFLLSLSSAAASIWFEENVVGSRGIEFTRGGAERLAVAARIPFFYLGKLLFPHPLIFNYPRWENAGDDILDFAPLLVLAAAALVLLRRWSTWGRAPFLGLAAFTISLFPVLGIFDVYGMRFSFVADHWAYLPALPVLVVAGAGLASLRRPPVPVRATAGAAILLTCGILTWKHTHRFRDPEMLWTETLARNPASWLAHDNLGVELQKRGRIDEAARHHRETLRLKPEYEKAHLNLGSVLQKQGRPDEAIDHYATAIRLRPKYAKAHLNLALALQSQGRTGEAIEHFREALRIDPGLPQAAFNLGNALLGLGRIDEAIEHYRHGLRLDPGYAQAHNNLGAALFRKNEIEAAIGHFRKALELQPGYADAENNLERAEALSRQRE